MGPFEKSELFPFGVQSFPCCGARFHVFLGELASDTTRVNLGRLFRASLAAGPNSGRPVYARQPGHPRIRELCTFCFWRTGLVPRAPLPVAQPRSWLWLQPFPWLCWLSNFREESLEVAWTLCTSARLRGRQKFQTPVHVCLFLHRGYPLSLMARSLARPLRVEMSVSEVYGGNSSCEGEPVAPV